MAWNQEYKTVLAFFTWGDQLQKYLFIIILIILSNCALFSSLSEDYLHIISKNTI